ncbi:response regulator [Oscillatoria sp. FACHB-1407]|uniref:response regulator n=1 Tax=Oscillatoria sp. FACHB-1407 TaxID=2692847 RepID=UPI001684D699|nr:response regulator [Oscillatoria sp. FACHB-1407]MBD2463119.1 response regulator [Oscillatoria sp. FACHB-1407]
MRSAQSAPVKQPFNTSVSSNSPAYTILLVENLSSDREVYCRYLLADSSCHYILLESSSATEALLICQNQHIDSILVNYALPDANGPDFLQMLQMQFDGQHPPVVFVASENDAAMAVRAIKLGAEDYLVNQTLTPEQLQLAMRSAIGANRRGELGANTPSQLQPWEQEEQSHLQHLNRDLTSRVAELQTLIEILPVGIAIASDRSCAQMQCNALMRQMLGVNAEQNISKSAPAAEQPRFQVFQNGQEIASKDLPMQMAAHLGIEVRDVEIEIRLPDGTSRQLLSYATPLWGDQHEIRGTVGAFLDITERKHIEAELCDREATIRRQFAELEGIYATAPVGLCFHDTDLRYVRINERLAEIDGVSVADHLGRTLREVLPELADTLEPLHHHVIERGEPILNVEIHGMTQAQPNVERDWIASYYPLKDGNNRVLGVNVVVQDITEHKQAQAEREQLLRQLEIERRFLEQTLQQLPSGVAIAEAPTGRLLFHNDEAIRLLRHPMDMSETYSGYANYGALHPDGRPYQPEEYPIARSVLIGEVVKAEEMSYRRGDGTETVFSVNAAPIVDPSGNRVAAVSTFEDISKRKQIEVERTHLLAEAETANRSKDEFVAMVAHELRSPLNAISGWAKLLQTRQFDPPTTQKALETIVRNTQTQVQLVEDLLDISRMVRGTLHLTLAPTNLAEVIEVAVETVRPTAEAKGLLLKMQRQQVEPVLGDLHRLQQIVLNLLANAIKFTPEGGHIQVELTQSDSQVQLQIRDTGKGINPEFLPHIFDRFRQDQQDTTTKQGLGLGLAIAKYLVEMHHGSVTAESAGEGQGATFTVKLPLQEPGKPDAGEPERVDGWERDQSALPSEQPLNDIRVLLVDDEPDVLNLAAFILEEYGAVVQTATNAPTALEQLPYFQPHILLSDVAMPEQNGYELLQQVRLLHPDKQIPAIALTAYAGEARQEESLRAGFRQHLTKPVEPEQLVTAILNAIDNDPHYG